MRKFAKEFLQYLYTVLFKLIFTFIQFIIQSSNLTKRVNPKPHEIYSKSPASCFSIAIKYYFYILLNIITAISLQMFTADQGIALQRHSSINEIKSVHREDCILPWPWANSGGLSKCYWTAKSSSRRS